MLNSDASLVRVDELEDFLRLHKENKLSAGVRACFQITSARFNRGISSQDIADAIAACPKGAELQLTIWIFTIEDYEILKIIGAAFDKFNASKIIIDFGAAQIPDKNAILFAEQASKCSIDTLSIRLKCNDTNDAVKKAFIELIYKHSNIHFQLNDIYLKKTPCPQEIKLLQLAALDQTSSLHSLPTDIIFQIGFFALKLSNQSKTEDKDTQDKDTQNIWSVTLPDSPKPHNRKKENCSMM